jgi:DNA polymerase-3 subunit gamma/tau
MFHLKYRPKKLDDFFGNDTVISSIKRDLQDKQISPTYLFYGVRGCGKTSIAHVLAKSLGGSKDSIYTYNAGNDNGIVTARDIITSSESKHVMGHNKVFILDEAHRVTSIAQSALLTWAEQPPKGVFLILCSTAPDKLLKELRDRCLQYEMKALSPNAQSALFDSVAKKEKLNFKPAVKDAILSFNIDGRPRKILMDMYRCRDLKSVKNVSEMLSGTDDDIATEAIEIARMLMKPKSLEWHLLVGLVDKLLSVTDIEGVRRMLFAYFSKVLRNAKSVEQITYCVFILDLLDEGMNSDSSLGLNGLIYLLGKIYVGMLASKG